MTDTTPAVRIDLEWLDAKIAKLEASAAKRYAGDGADAAIANAMSKHDGVEADKLKAIRIALAAAPVAPADSGLPANPVDASSRTDPVGNVAPDGAGDDLLIQRARELASLDGDFGALTTPYAKLTLTAMANRLAALRARSEPDAGRWYAAEDIDRMVREIDVAMNGDGAARQAKLCDIFKQIIERVSEPEAGAVAWADETAFHALSHGRKAVVEPVRNAFGANKPLYTHPAPSDSSATERMRAALIQADLKIRSFPGTDQSDVEFIRAALGEA